MYVWLNRAGCSKDVSKLYDVGLYLADIVYYFYNGLLQHRSVCI